MDFSNRDNRFLGNIDRRKHFYKGLSDSEYHHYYDNLKHQSFIKSKNKNMKNIKMSKCDQDIDLEDKSSLHKSRVPWTIYKDSTLYKVFKNLIYISSAISAFLYPHFIICGFPEINNIESIFLICVETVFLFDIIIKFFLQNTNEQGNTLN